MLQLLLMRHAKAEPGGSGIPDRERPLAERGRGDAGQMGAAVAADGLSPDVALCSPSVRTRQTLDAMLPSFATAPRIVIADELYTADETDYVGTIAASAGSARRLLVVAHNPTIHATALLLAGSGDKSLRSDLAAKFPTAAVAVISFDLGAWPDIRSGGGELVSFRRPRDLGSGDADE